MTERDTDQDHSSPLPGGQDRRGSKHPCPVVGMGASAGGLDAFQAFFSRMPPDSGMAFVLVQHLHPRHDTLMPELLARHTSMPVQLVTDRTVAEPNRVYVIPPNSTLTIDGCVLYVSRQGGGRGRRAPIDGFFRSLAEDQGDDAVAIILSGAGADGALGLKTVKEHGGMTMVQAPATASYDSMPRSAILTGAADCVLPVEQMPGALMEYLGKLKEARGGSGAEGFREQIEDHLEKIAAHLRRKTGHDFSRYKRSTLVRRIRRRMHVLGAPSVSAYVEQLKEIPQEADQLFRDLLIGVTHFFRDPESFELLAARAVPRLFEGKGMDEQVRVWVPGCATGEEAYSIAILLREHLDRLEDPPRVLIFASDIDGQALETARQGWYPETIAGQVSAERLERFFTRHGNLYQVSREIREMCLFSLHNLIADPPFSRLDLISCRNLLIYLESDLQKKLVPLYHYALRSGGYLFLGPSENVANHPELFRTVDKRHRVFQRKETVLRSPMSFPLAERGRPGGYRPHFEGARRPTPREADVSKVLEAILLEGYAPACVVVNQRSEVVYLSPRTGKYLELPAGAPSLNLVDMAREGLRLDLRTALHKAMASGVPVVHQEVPLEPGSDSRHGLRVNLVVRPLPELGDDSGLYMVIFQEVRPVTAGLDGTETAGDAGAPAGGRAEAQSALVRRLEAELRSAKDHLQATLEELESSNEELVSSNEELLSINEEMQAANEELQTSKEELQSVNEELESVNAELKKKIVQNSQLAAIVESSQEAILGKNLDGVITSWNAGAERLYGYRAEEAVGCSLDFLLPPEGRQEMRLLFDRVRRGERVESLETVRVRKDGRRIHILLTFSPVRDERGELVGVSGIEHDITGRREAEEGLQEAARRKDEFLAVLGHELRNPLAPIRNCLHVLNEPDATAEHGERARQTIERQVLHLTRLVDDLLDISRISRGKILLRQERLDLAELVRREVEDRRGAMQAAGLTLGLELPDEPVWMTGDPTRLAQSVGNLLQNAIKFTGRDGRVAVSVRDEPESGMATVSVRDTGMGMAPELLGRLFEPFSQADRSLDRSRGGLGLGLALVKSLVGLHGGTVEAHSDGEEKGAELVIRLPRLPVSFPEPVRPPDVARSGGSRPHRCLIIEDHRDAADSLRTLLELAGHDVEVAYDGIQGVEKARRFRPEIVLCDIGLPDGMDGYAVARALRADPEVGGLRLVALSGYGQAEDQRRALEAGFDAHLTKPADPEGLRRLLAGLP